MIKLHRLLAVILCEIIGWLLYWAKMSVAMVGRMGNDFVFVVVVWCMRTRKSEF
jgi:hypothetical protein